MDVRKCYPGLVSSLNETNQPCIYGWENKRDKIEQLCQVGCTSTMKQVGAIGNLREDGVSI